MVLSSVIGKCMYVQGENEDEQDIIEGVRKVSASIYFTEKCAN